MVDVYFGNSCCGCSSQDRSRFLLVLSQLLQPDRLEECNRLGTSGCLRITISSSWSARNCIKSIGNNTQSWHNVMPSHCQLVSAAAAAGYKSKLTSHSAAFLCAPPSAASGKFRVRFCFAKLCLAAAVSI